MFRCSESCPLFGVSFIRRFHCTCIIEGLSVKRGISDIFIFLRKMGSKFKRIFCDH